MSKSGRSRRGSGGFDDWAPPNSIIYKDANGRWHALVPGVAGRFLQTQGLSAPPAWAVPAGGGGGAGHTIQEEGSPLTARTGLNFTGAGIAAADDSANDRTNIIVPGYTIFVPSGTGHAPGLVPDPGATAGVTKFLREDGSWITPSGGNGHVIQEEGSPLTARAGLNFTGAGIAASDDSGNDRTNIIVPGYSNFVPSGAGHAAGLVPDPGATAGVTKFLREDGSWIAPSGGGGSGHTIQDEGTSLTARTRLNFAGDGVTVTDDSGGDRTIVTIPGGGGSASKLYVVRRGLLFYDDFGGYSGSVNYANNNPQRGWKSGTGTWNVGNTTPGWLQSATGANDEFIYNTNVYGSDYIVEVAARQGNSSQYFGILMGVLPTGVRADNGFLCKNADFQFTYHNPGLSAATGVSSVTIVSGTTYRLKGQVRPSNAFANHYGSGWLDRVQKIVDFNSSIGMTGPGFPGLGIYGGSPEYELFCVYTERSIRVSGLSSTQAFRLFDSSGTVIGGSAAQIGGQAALDIMALIDCPFKGYIKLYTDTSWGTEVTDARWPASGSDPMICGGDHFCYAASETTGGGGSAMTDYATASWFGTD